MGEEESSPGNGGSFSIDVSTNNVSSIDGDESENEEHENNSRDITGYDSKDISEPVQERTRGGGSGVTDSGNSERKGTDVSEMNLAEKGSLVTGWFMFSIALALFILSLSIFLFGLEMVFSNKKFPDDTDTPCYLSFLVMAIIFLVLGIVYRDMALHPEFFSEENREKSVHLTKKEEWERIKKRVKEHDLEAKDLLDGDENSES